MEIFVNELDYYCNKILKCLCIEKCLVILCSSFGEELKDLNGSDGYLFVSLPLLGTGLFEKTTETFDFFARKPSLTYYKFHHDVFVHRVIQRY